MKFWTRTWIFEFQRTHSKSFHSAGHIKIENFRKLLVYANNSFRFQIFQIVTWVSSLVPIRGAYPGIIIATGMRIVTMAATRRTARLSPVPVNSCVPKADRTVNRNVYQNLNFVIRKKTAKIISTKTRPAVSIRSLYSGHSDYDFWFTFLYSYWTDWLLCSQQQPSVVQPWIVRTSVIRLHQEEFAFVRMVIKSETIAGRA